MPSTQQKSAWWEQEWLKILLLTIILPSKYQTKNKGTSPKDSQLTTVPRQMPIWRLGASLKASTLRDTQAHAKRLLSEIKAYRPDRIFYNPIETQHPSSRQVVHTGTRTQTAGSDKEKLLQQEMAHWFKKATGRSNATNLNCDNNKVGRDLKRIMNRYNNRIQANPNAADVNYHNIE